MRVYKLFFLKIDNNGIHFNTKNFDAKTLMNGV